MKRLLRWRFALPALAILAFLGIRAYTRSTAAADLVREKLETSLGTRVEFDTLSVGLFDSSIKSVRVVEPGAPADAEPLLAAKQIDVDIAGVGAIRGRDPSTIRLQEARVLLRFDHNGDLLTKFPKSTGQGGSLSKLEFDSSTLIIRQEGHPDAEFRNLNLRLDFQGSQATLDGTADDPDWGRWIITGRIPTGDTGQGTVTLQSEQAQTVSPELLRRTPFVNPNAWSEVALRGSTTAKIDLTYDARTADVGYRIALNPIKTHVSLPTLRLEFADAAGGFVAENGILTLRDVVGRTADGTVRVNSKMDFTAPKQVLRFETELAGLQVSKLPRDWKLPEGVEGSLSGKLDFTVTLPRDGGTQISASGNAVISDARLNGTRLDPIELDIRSDSGNGLRFAERPQSGGGLGGQIARAVLQATQQVPKVEKWINVDLKLNNVSVAELLQATGANVRVPIGGKLSAQLRLSMPESAPDDVKRYRISGNIEKGALEVDGVHIENVSAKLSMADGKLRVTDLTGEGPKALGGSVRAAGDLSIEAPHAFQATIKFENYPLTAWDRVQKLASVSGLANAEARVNGTLEPLNVRSNGNLRIAKLRTGDGEAGDLSLTWTTDDDYLRLNDAKARIFDGVVSGGLEIPLRESLPAKGAIKIENLDLTAASNAILAKAKLKLEGKANGSVTLRNPKIEKPGEVRTIADIELTAPTLKLQGITAKKIKGVATYAKEILRYELTGDALGGQFEVTGRYPPEEKAEPPRSSRKKPVRDEELMVAGRLRLRNVQLSATWELLGLKQPLGPLAGDVNLDFPFSFDRDGRLVGAGRIRAERLTWNAKDLSSGGEAIVRISPASIVFEDVSFFVGEGVIRAHIDYDRDESQRREATIALSNVPAKRLFFLAPELARFFDLAVDGRLTTKIGREWRGSGVLTSSRGKIRGVPVSDVRIPIEWTAVPELSRSEIRIRDAFATAASGQMTGRAEMRVFNDLPPRLSGEIGFRGVNISQAFKSESELTGKLHVSGKLEFSAEQLRTANDLKGKIQAKLGESQPFTLPVFSSIAPFIGLASTSPQVPTVREGDVDAVLANGVWRVQKFTLIGPSMDLYAEGTMGVGGRLNLDVVAHTRQSPDQRALQRIVPIPSASAVATTTFTPRQLLSLSGFVGRYVVYLDLTGTTDSPVVRLQTVRTVSENAVRFFLFRFLAPLP